MTKKRKKPSNRRVNRNNRSGNLKAVPFSLRQLTVLWGASDPKKANDYLRRFLSYENWISRGRPQNYSTHLFPAEYERIAIEWPQGFSFYRDSLAMYLERVLNLSPCVSYINSLLRRIEQCDPEGYIELHSVADEASFRYAKQANNAINAMHEALDSDPIESYIRQFLHAYCDFYEIDFPLWFIGVLSKFERTGQIDVESFGGPNSETSKGTLVGQILDKVAGSPLEEVVRSAYLPDLRNAVSHNEIEITANESGVVSVRSIRTGQKWKMDLLATTLVNVHGLSNSVHTVAAHGSNLLEALQAEELPRIGIMNRLTIAHYDTQIVTIFIFQLWCFYNLDPLGAWVDTTTIRVNLNRDENVESVYLGDMIICSDLKKEKLDTNKEMLKAFSVGWAEIIRVPIGPDLGLGYPNYVYDGQQFEVLGVPDRHVVPIHISK